jgi:lauroyl/myristoyl acyltransferase
VSGPTASPRVPPGRLLGELPPAGPEPLGVRLSELQYRAVWAAAERLPERIARRLPDRLGRAWLAAAPARQREQVARNLARVLGRRSGTVERSVLLAAYTSYARYWLDAFRLHVLDVDRVLSESPGEGLEHVDGMRDSGRGGVLATAHLGSWDVGALWSAHRRWGMVVVAEVVAPRRLFERFVGLRVRAGIDVVPLVRGGPMLDALEDRVGRGGLATLLADRDLTRRGPIVAFFGEPCRLPPGTAALARRTGRPVATGAWLTDGDGFRGVVLPPVDLSGLDVLDGTQAVAHELERLVALAPEQWHVFVPNWLADREPDHPVVAAHRAGRDWRRLARAEWEAARRSGRDAEPDR